MNTRTATNTIISVIIPAYNVESNIEAVIKSLPKFVTYIIVVDDASTDNTDTVLDKISRADNRIVLHPHQYNQGVGGAMRSGFKEALALSSQIVIKIDGDGQMSAKDLPNLVQPLISGAADYAKGNRFRDFHALRKMPAIRLMGNTVLSFLVKAATGYWDCFDPSNGFVAIRGDVLSQIPLEKIHPSYFFEISMLSQLYLLDAFVINIPMEARYGDEQSNLSILQVLAEFPWQLGIIFFRRILLKKFLFNFSMDSIYLLFGLPMIVFSSFFGLSKWIHFAQLGVGAPTGTIMVATLTLILGFQMLLSAVHIDLQNAPQTPINNGPLE